HGGLERLVMNQISSRQYDDEEVTRILRRALKLKRTHGISYQDLVDTAQEIGIDPQTVGTAIKQEHREFKNERNRKARLKRRKAGFYSHLWSYLIVNGALLILNYYTPGPWWFQWPVLGWGIGLAFHFKAIFFPTGNRLIKGMKTKNVRARLIMCE
ncbi:MAG: 2TM domain-containing protein, partial [Deltaproteobacteria bacterium]|nr:2TM domain-containing protein [Deltaproteobacteria bacterium]